MEDDAARELAPRDILENVVVKVADQVEVDVSRISRFTNVCRQARGVRFGAVELG